MPLASTNCVGAVWCVYVVMSNILCGALGSGLGRLAGVTDRYEVQRLTPWAMPPQPNLVPVIWATSSNAHNSGTSSVTSNVRIWPLISRLIIGLAHGELIKSALPRCRQRQGALIAPF